MQYGINIGCLLKNHTMEEAAEAVARTGFTMLDYTPPLLPDNWDTVMKEHQAIFKDHGLTVHQTHAPFNRYGSYGDKHRLCMDRCMEATAYLGAQYVAVHGDEFDFETLSFTPEAALAYNHDYFLPYVEQSNTLGCKLAFETVFEDSAVKRRFTSEPAELLALIRSYGDSAAVCCWDFGHANVSFPREAPAVIRQFGPLIRCTHVHDNTGTDSHMIPMTGNINWQETMAAFHDIGYRGVLSLEYGVRLIGDTPLGDFAASSCKVVDSLWKL